MKIRYRAPDNELIILNLDNFSIEGISNEMKVDEETKIFHKVLAINTNTNATYSLYEGDNYELVIEEIYKNIRDRIEIMNLEEFIKLINKK